MKAKVIKKSRILNGTAEMWNSKWGKVARNENVFIKLRGNSQ